MKHKHAELIHAWADGAQIECKQHGYENCWADVGYPNWENPYCVYRIKPMRNPDFYTYLAVTHSYTGTQALCRYGSDNVKFTYDGETRKLISAEVLK